MFTSGCNHRTSKTQPRMFSSQRGPSLEAHWKAATAESLISLRYWTPFEISVSRFGPVVSGPNALHEHNT